MFDRRDDPDHLLASLELFLRHWNGPRRGWYGIAEEKLATAALPQPLRRLYAFAGNWPGDNYSGFAFNYQDCLFPFEMLEAQHGKLVFACENQGCWACGTTSEGNDPPVWVTEVFTVGLPWQPLCDSLAQFLVTLCLHETLFGCKYRATADHLLESMLAKGMQVSPLWLGGPYVRLLDDGPLVRLSFHLVNGRLLVMDDRWCGTNSEQIALALPELFKPPDSSPEVQAGIPLWENAAIPALVRRTKLESLAQSHEEQAEYHAKQAVTFRRMAASMINDQEDNQGNAKGDVEEDIPY
jgi:hypothetical protein